MDERAEREFRDYVASRQAVLYRAALLLTGHREDAEDLLQAALSRLALHWDRVASSADAYVRKILYHQQVGRWRRRGREYAVDALPEPAAAPDPSDQASLRVTLAAVLRQLTPRQRAVLVLRFYEDLPEGQVAEILGCSVGTVRSMTSRTLARVRALAPELVTPVTTS
jgi:RNA polymerase sigma-70 factor (sigma-E family)